MDLTEYLNAWPYDPEHSVKLLTANDGRPIMQVRLPLGIEQYDLDGRPDGQKIMDRPTALDGYLERIQAADLKGEDFVIEHDDFLLLQSEGVLFYYRYVLLFQAGDYKRAARDTDHNLKLCEIIERFCPIQDDRNSILQYRPYIIRINSISKAMLALQKNDPEGAREYIDAAIEEVKALEKIDSPVFDLEKIRSLDQLRTVMKQVEGTQQSNPISDLEAKLNKAVEDENYELAARLRDRIASMKENRG